MSVYNLSIGALVCTINCIGVSILSSPYFKYPNWDGNRSIFYWNLMHSSDIALLVQLHCVVAAVAVCQIPNMGSTWVPGRACLWHAVGVDHI